MGHEERVAFVIEAMNRVGPGVKAALADIKQGTAAMKTSAAGVGAAFTEAGKTISAATTRIRTTLTTISETAHKVGASFSHMAQSAKAGLDVVGGQLKTIATGMAAIGAAGVGALGAFGAMGVASNTFRENTLAALEGMTKSKAAAVDLYSFLTKFADVTPFDDQEIVDAGKALLTFGFNAKQVLGLVGDTAFTMKVPLEQVVGVLAKLKAGMFDTAEMAPVGITQEGMKAFGAQFSDSGEPQNRGALLGQGMALLQQKFGGAMGAGASGFDAASSTFESTFRRMAQMASSGLFESIKKAFDTATKAVQGFMDSGKAMGALTVIFDAVGRAIEIAANSLGGFADWLDQVVTRSGIALFLTNVIALLETVGQSILKTFGVDLKAAMDPKNVTAFFDALAVAADQGISTFFGIGRVAAEVVRIAMSAFEDLGDHVSDIVSDVTRGFKGMFLSMQISMAEMTAMMLDNVSEVLRALSRVQVGWWKPFENLEGTADDLRIQARGMYAPGGQIAQLTQQRGNLTSEGLQDQAARQARAQTRLGADPFRNDNFFKRIGDAFTGRPGQQGAEDAFRALLESNRMGIARALFAGAAATAPIAPFPAAPMLYGGGGTGGGSVSYPRSMTPAIPSLPDYMQPGYGTTDAFAADYSRQRDQGFQYGSMYGGNTYNFAPNVTLDRATLRRMFDQWLDEVTREATPGPATF